MKVFRFIYYDISEGIYKNWYKWLLLIAFSVVVCFAGTVRLNNGVISHTEDPNVLTILLYYYYGALPYQFEFFGSHTFEIPYEWLMLNVIISYIIGDYVCGDIKNCGKMFMIQSGNRYTWWISKCLWCIFVNLLIHIFVILSVMGYSWMSYGTISLEKQRIFLMMFGRDFISINKLTVYLMPFLSSLASTLLQINLSIFLKSEAAFLIMIIYYVASAYYSNAFLPPTYMMTIRYSLEMLKRNYSALRLDFGVIYLLVVSVSLSLMGYHLLIKKKDII